LRQFAAELEDADASLFFYAGHGLQVQRVNYLVPIDAALESEVDLPFEAVAVDVVLDLMEQMTPQRLVFLDACRDNPLARRLARSGSESRSLGVGRGLARMNNRVGTLIAFATEPDKVALDGEGDHSPFTKALLQHIETPGIEVRQMLSRVRGTVIDNTNGEQLPLDTSALVDDFYFASIEPTPPVVAAPVVPAPAVAASNDNSTEHLFWNTIQASTDPNDFEAYLARYPDGAFAPLARNRLAVLGARRGTEVAALTPTQPILPAPQPEPAPQAVLPAPAPAVEVEPIDTTLVATRNVNVRGAPNTDHDPVGVVPAGAEVAVVGKVIGANWYRIGSRTAARPMSSRRCSSRPQRWSPPPRPHRRRSPRPRQHRPRPQRSRCPQHRSRWPRSRRASPLPAPTSSRRPVRAPSRPPGSTPPLCSPRSVSAGATPCFASTTASKGT
jgi:uncharacterized caspase-like protein